MEILRQLLSQDPHVQHLLEDIKSGQEAQLITGLSGSARPAFLYTIYDTIQKPIYIISPNLLQAQKTFDDLVKLLGEDNVHYYPADEFIAADMSIASPELRAQRIETLDHMLHQQKGIYIIPVAGMRKILPQKKNG